MGVEGARGPIEKRALPDRRRQEPALRDLLRRKYGERMETHGATEARSPEYLPPPEPPDWR